MNVELNNDETNLLAMLLDKELGETRLEIRHAENAHYKEHLKEREEKIRSILDRVAPGMEQPVSIKR